MASGEDGIDGPTYPVRIRTPGEVRPPSLTPMQLDLLCKDLVLAVATAMGSPGAILITLVDALQHLREGIPSNTVPLRPAAKELTSISRRSSPSRIPILWHEPGPPSILGSRRTPIQLTPEPPELDAPYSLATRNKAEEKESIKASTCRSPRRGFSPKFTVGSVENELKCFMNDIVFAGRFKHCATNR